MLKLLKIMIINNINMDFEVILGLIIGSVGICPTHAPLEREGRIESSENATKITKNGAKSSLRYQ